MDIQWYGANCIVISSKQARLVIDDNLASLGSKSVIKEGDVVLCTSPQSAGPVHNAKLFIDQPGEYEVSAVSIYGIATRNHIDEQGKTTNTLYKIMTDDLSILITGHIYPELSDSQLEAIGMVDVMLIPVGGNGYTLDAIDALKLIKKIEPKIVVPTHFDDPKFNFPVPQQTLDEALKGLAMEPKETVSKLRVKPGELTDTTQLIVLDRS